VAHILITGMSGTGKTTVLKELQRRGHRTVDTDYGGWTMPDRTWDEPQMDALLASHETVFVSGTVDNQGRFYGAFSEIVLLSAPLEVILERVRTRTTNPYGKTAEQQNEIRHYLETVEPLLRASAGVELDARLPVTELANALEVLIGPARPDRTQTR
jgi:shikimate kinase